MARPGELDRVLEPRLVLTDWNDGRRADFSVHGVRCSAVKVSRELYYIAPPNDSRMKADAPREWYPRLRCCIQDRRRALLLIVLAFWRFRDRKRNIVGLADGYVDDILLIRSDLSHASFIDISEELGLGNVEVGSFVWCRKRIAKAEDGSIRASMLYSYRTSYALRRMDSKQWAPLRTVVGMSASSHHMKLNASVVMFASEFSPSWRNDVSSFDTGILHDWRHA